MSVGDRLRTETRDLHTRAEKGPFQAAMLSGRLPREHYERNLEQMLLVHRALEGRLRASTHPAIRAVVTDEQYQEPYLEEDLAHFGRDPGAITPCDATRTLVARIDEADDLGLLGFHYVLEGSNNGNRYIAKVVGRLYEITPDAGMRYLDPYGERQPEVWGAFKEALASVTFTDAEQDAIVEGAKRMFEGIIAIHDDLNKAVEHPVA